MGSLYLYVFVTLGLPVDVLQFATYRTMLVALFCGCLSVVACIFLLRCRRRWSARRRRRRRERKLRQRAKHRPCADEPTTTDVDEPATVGDGPSTVTGVCGAPPSRRQLAAARHDVCHCLPRGLRRKSPATAVIRRGRSLESLQPDRRDAATPSPPPLTCSASAVALSPRAAAAESSRPDLAQVSANVDDDDATSGAQRWRPITVAGETTFPVQPSAAVFLSFDVDESVRSCRSFK